MKNLHIRFSRKDKVLFKPVRQLDEWIAENVFYEPKPKTKLNIPLYSSIGGEYSEKQQWYFVRHENDWIPRYYSADINEAFYALEQITRNCFRGSVHQLDHGYIRCDIWVAIRSPEPELVTSVEVYDNPALAICEAIKKAYEWDKERINKLHQ